MISRKAAIDEVHLRHRWAAQSRYLAVSRWFSVHVGICGAVEEAQRAASARRRPTGIAVNNDGDTVASSPGSADTREAIREKSSSTKEQVEGDSGGAARGFYRRRFDLGEL